MDVFSKSNWIWPNCEESADSYAEFFDGFTYSGGAALIRISCDSDYVLYVNGAYVASNQYGDFEHYKIYDEIDITDRLKVGTNAITVRVHHCGVPTSRYRPAKAGLIYEITADGEIITYSGEYTLSRISPCYESGLCRQVSPQLGFTFSFDATKGSSKGFEPATVVEKDCTLFPRPIRKLRVLPRHNAEVLINEGTRFLIDLGGETVGLPTLELISPVSQTVTVAWGEHTADGRVRHTVGNRNFYFEYKCVEGHNLFTEYMLRLGCRYLEVTCNEPIELIYAGVLPQVYDAEAVSYQADSELDQKIYEICLNTLKLCMMEHYADCPWREQALYAFDSRNQMLSGYYAFEGGNADYARANLILISEDRREDGLLSICYPCGRDRAIPSFSLHYVTAVREYLEHTGDVDTARRITPKIRGILDEFIMNSDGHLIMSFAGENMWNFYDWSKYLDGHIEAPGVRECDLVINCLYILALDSFEKICESTGESFGYEDIADGLRRSVRNTFLDERGMLSFREGAKEYTVLGNALAILAGVVTGDEARALCEMIRSSDTTDCSLSMKAFEYDALLLADEEKYAPIIIDEIRRSYKIMLDAGSDTVWETLEGASAFNNAGSLCHGWSAIPIYYYHRLGLIK